MADYTAQDLKTDLEPMDQIMEQKRLDRLCRLLSCARLASNKSGGE